MKITIHRGTREIGGSCVEIVALSTRIVLDLGLPIVDVNREPFDSRMALTKSNEELRQEKVIPAVAGLFDESHAPPDAILLSHAHLDHAGLLHRSRAEVPIYTTAGTSKMMLAAGVFAGQKSLDRNRFRPVTSQQTYRVGDLCITPLSVDHSIFGSVAYLIEGDGKAVLYTGDFRNHGRKPGMMRDLLAFVRGKSIDVLIVEGTHFGGEREQGRSEFELEVEIKNLVESAPALVLACFSALDIDRLVTIYKATQAAGRTLVIDAYAAFVLHLLGSSVGTPKPTKEYGIRVFLNSHFEKRNLVEIRRRFEEVQIELSEVLREEHRYVMMFRPSMLESDFGGSLPKHCRCLYGYWKGYLTKPDWQELQNVIEGAQGDFIPAHVSGHAYIRDVIELVNAIQPRHILPIHTFSPESFHEQFANVVAIEDGLPWEIL